MTQLSDEAARLLHAARADAPAPSGKARARIKRAVLLSIGAPISAAAGAGASVGAAKAGLLSALLVGGAAVVVGAGGTWGVIKYSSAPSTPARTLPAAVSARPPPPLTELAGPQLVPEDPLEPIPPTRPSAPPVPRPRAVEAEVGPVAATPEIPLPEGAAPPRPRTASEEVRLREELQALAEAMAQSDGQQWGPTLDALDRYDARFPNGVLSPEAQVLRVLSLCGLDRKEEARALASRLARTSPDSPGVQRLKTSCAAP